MLATVFIPRDENMSGFIEKLREDAALITASFFAATGRPCDPGAIERICLLPSADRFPLIDALFGSGEDSAENGCLSQFDNPCSRRSKYSRQFGPILVELHYESAGNFANLQIRTAKGSQMNAELLKWLRKALTALPENSGWVCTLSERGWFPFCGYFDDREFTSSITEVDHLLTTWPDVKE